jgi:hypothetical protein
MAASGWLNNLPPIHPVSKPRARLDLILVISRFVAVVLTHGVDDAVASPGISRYAAGIPHVD